MKFSIVTLAFRQRKFLEEAINSVLSQDYPDIEYIVIQPGRTTEAAKSSRPTGTA